MARMAAVGQGREPVFFRHAASERPSVLQWTPYIHVWTGSAKRTRWILKNELTKLGGKRRSGKKGMERGFAQNTLHACMKASDLCQ